MIRLKASYALTERNHGSDMRSLNTRVVRDGEHWVLDGQKAFITSGTSGRRDGPDRVRALSTRF
ncbi:acyl-CoA dehydrogenase family protein [Ideonella sp. YS5]|uniref:acyl-CoA dehydrogenase family protein n=1 Tax=Ideonella sp. YS5 TaxID=3453714 RepID=UPI003EE835B2